MEESQVGCALSGSAAIACISVVHVSVLLCRSDLFYNKLVVLVCVYFPPTTISTRVLFIFPLQVALFTSSVHFITLFPLRRGKYHFFFFLFHFMPDLGGCPGSFGGPTWRCSFGSSPLPSTPTRMEHAYKAMIVVIIRIRIRGLAAHISMSLINKI